MNVLTAFHTRNTLIAARALSSWITNQQG